MVTFMDFHSPPEMLLIISWVLTGPAGSSVLLLSLVLYGGRKWASRRMSVPYSLIVQPHLYDGHFAFPHTFGGENPHHRKRQNRPTKKYLTMHANAVYLNVFITFPRPDIHDQCLRLRWLVAISDTLYLGQIHCSIQCIGETRHDTNFLF